jgi:hypothetical protein
VEWSRTCQGRDAVNLRFWVDPAKGGLVYLAELPRLQALYMYGIAVGAIGLDCLKQMTKLKGLYVTDGLLGETDERVLVRALPGLRIHRHIPRGHS